MLHQRKVVLIGLMFVIVAIIVAPSSAVAYRAGSKWQNTRVIDYNLDPNNDARLRVTGSANQIGVAANRWTANTIVSFRNTAYDPNGNVVTTANFQAGSPCGGGPRDDYVAVVCVFANTTTINRTRMYFNISPTYSWNTGAQMNCGASPRRVDVLAVSLHELGHYFHLGDNPPAHPEAIMSFNCTYKVDPLSEDDLQGVTQMYGPKTGWEFGQATGQRNERRFWRSVSGYDSGSPELGPVSTEFGVAPITGSKQLRMAGRADAAYSYSYFTLFTGDKNSNADRNYLNIRSGMKLKWRQYNFQQSTMSVDLIMTDGTSLRDSGLRDQNNLTVHPAGRGAVPTGQWLYFEVDLSPLAGKVVNHYLIAYDNGNNGRTGQFRAYFDDLQITYP